MLKEVGQRGSRRNGLAVFAGSSCRAWSERIQLLVGLVDVSDFSFSLEPADLGRCVMAHRHLRLGAL